MTLNLPIIQHPTYSVKLPSTGEELIVRPFVTKEEKILLMANLSDDSRDYLRACKQIIQNCVTQWSKKVKSAKELTLFDLEYVMLQLRIHSVGDEAPIHFRGIDTSECEKCKEDISIKLDLKTVETPKLENIDNKIMITDKQGLTLKFLTIEDQENLLKIQKSQSLDKNETLDSDSLGILVDDIFLTVAMCVETIFDESSVIKVQLEDIESVKVWLEDMPKVVFQKIEDFLSKTPTLKHELTLCCPVCQREQIYTFEGLESFFV